MDVNQLRYYPLCRLEGLRNAASVMGAKNLGFFSGHTLIFVRVSLSDPVPEAALSKA